MCRVLLYTGNPILLDDILFKTDKSLVKQSYLSHEFQDFYGNLAGFGITTWLDPTRKNSVTYKTTNLPFQDNNLKNFASNVYSSHFLAHVRGVPYFGGESIIESNVHPFLYKDMHLALAHNGYFTHLPEMRIEMLKYISNEVKRHLEGVTDSEYIYAIIMSQLVDPYSFPTLQEATDAIIKTLEILNEIRVRMGLLVESPLNLFIASADYVLILRYCLHYGLYIESPYQRHLPYRPLWYTYGENYQFDGEEYRMVGDKRESIIFASEPITSDVTSWIMIPEYTLVQSWMEDGEAQIHSLDIDL